MPRLAAPRPGAAPRTAARNIESILRIEKEDKRQLQPHHRIFHAIGWFVGTVYFFVFQCLAVAVWISANSLAATQSWHFDEFPFPLLSAVLALEAVLLTSCVLIRQNVIDQTSERRNHLDLQINLLADGKRRRRSISCSASPRISGCPSQKRPRKKTSPTRHRWMASPVIYARGKRYKRGIADNERHVELTGALKS